MSNGFLQRLRARLFPPPLPTRVERCPGCGEWGGRQAYDPDTRALVGAVQLCQRCDDEQWDAAFGVPPRSER